MALLQRDAILQAQDISTETVPVPEWGGEVLVRGLTGAERDAFERSMVEYSGKTPKMKLENFRAKLVVLSVVDENGQRLFADDDLKQLSGKSAAALARVFDAASRLSGFGESDIEELTKN